MSSTSKITKRDKQMYLIWTVPITHLRHAFIQCCASFPLLRWEYLYAMAAAIKNMDSAVTWPRYQTKKSEGSRVPDYLQGSENGRVVTIASNSPHLFANSPHYQIGQLTPREFLYYKANNISKIQIANSPHFYLVSSFYLWMFTECKCWIKDVCQLAPTWLFILHG